MAGTPRPVLRRATAATALLAALTLAACTGGDDGAGGGREVAFYAFAEQSGSFRAAAEDCTRRADGRYRIRIEDLPQDADAQREQLVRRLAAEDSDIDVMTMDVIWTAEFAEAEWITPVPEDLVPRIEQGTLETPLETARYDDRLYVAPFNSNTQLLWYRKDRVREPPRTWEELLEQAERIGRPGTIQVQGGQFEALTVWFSALVGTAGGRIVDEEGNVTLGDEAETAARIMRDVTASGAADPSVASQREDQNRLAFEQGDATFMVNYPFVYPSARDNAPEVFRNMAWAPWPGIGDRPGAPVVGGFNLGVSAFSEQPDLAWDAVLCLRSAANQKRNAIKGGLPPTLAALYEEGELGEDYPFAPLIRDAIERGTVRPVNPAYNDISLAVQKGLHPPGEIDPGTAIAELRTKIEKATESGGLL